MDSDEFLSLLEENNRVPLDKDIPKEALDAYFSEPRSVDSIKALKRHGLTDLEIGFIVGFENGRTRDRDTNGTQTTPERSLMYR